MATGMEMMLQAAIKAMNIDPAEIKASIDGFKNLAVTMNERQKSIDEKLDQILIEITTMKNGDSKLKLISSETEKAG